MNKSVNLLFILLSIFGTQETLAEAIKMDKNTLSRTATNEYFNKEQNKQKLSNKNQPLGVWKLENNDPETLIGVLELKKESFNLIFLSKSCDTYPASGTIKPSSEGTWELKNSHDYSLTFKMKRHSIGIEIIDSEGEQLLFSKSSHSLINDDAQKQCKKK